MIENQQQQQVPVDEIIIRLIEFNQSNLDRFVSLLERIESHLIEGDPNLQGQVEEILRQIIQIAQDSIEAILSLQEQLQTAIIESFFPAQD